VAHSADIRFRGRRAAALVATVLLGVISYQLNATMTTPVLPDMARALGVSIEQVSYVSSVFFLAGAVGAVVLSRWSDFVGRKTALLAVMGALSLGTIICIMAPNLPTLLVGRVLQGTSAATFEFAYLVIREWVAPELFGLSIGIITSIGGGVAGIDGYLGSVISEHYGYRAIFAVILVAGAVAAIMGLAVIPADAEGKNGKGMDWWGGAALSMFLILLSSLLSAISAQGLFSASAIELLVAAAVAFGGFMAVEYKVAAPLIAIRLLCSRPVWSILGTTVLTLASAFAVTNFTVVLLAQDQAVGFGLKPSAAALLFLTPAALIGTLSAPFAGWLAGRYGWERVLRIGLVCNVGLIGLLAAMPHKVPLVCVLVASLGLTFNGLALTTLNGLGVLLSPAEAPGALPGLNGAAFGFGLSAGIGIVAPFAGEHTLAGFQDALAISGAIAVFALLASGLIPRPRAVR
jgi:MFS family permease